jgi:tetratricopeptide (TPR) repeat protein
VTSGAGPDQSGRADDAKHIAEAYFETGNYERVREVLRGPLSEHPNDPALLADFARTEYLLKNYQSAASSAYAALSVAPQDELAMRIYAVTLDELGRLHDALWVAWRGVITHPNEPLQHRVYARLLQASRQLPSALLAVDQALRLNPASADALVLRGSILHDMGRIPESTAAYQQALSLDPGNAAALNNLAVNRLRGNKFRHALRGFTAAAGLDPSLGDLARRNIGVVLANMLRRITVLAVVLGLEVAVVGSSPSMDRRTLMIRVLGGMLAAMLIANLGSLLRATRRRVLAAILKDRPFVAARIGHALLAVGAGAWVAIFGGAPWTIPAGVLLIVSGLILMRVGLFIGS